MLLLINPPQKDFFEKKHFNISRQENQTVSLPLGLAYIAASVRKAGYRVECLDLNVEEFTIEDVIKRINSKDIKFIGLTSTTPLMKNTIKIASEIKSKTNAKIILGGIHITSEPLETISLNCFDIGVLGEGEETIVKILANQRLEEVNGIVFKKGKKIILNPTKPTSTDLNDLPFPARDLFPLDKYKPSNHRKLGAEDTYNVLIASRGCPFGCKFCASKKMFGKKVNFRSPSSVINEIKQVIDVTKSNKIMFYDDTMTANHKFITEFTSLIKKEKLDITWGSNTRLDTINNDLLNIMHKTGYKRAFVGVESGDDEILKSMNKCLTIRQISQGIEKLKAFGIEISASHIIGAPGETRDSIIKTINFAIKNKTNFAHFYVFTPDPGADYYELLKKKGVIKPMEWLDYDNMIRKGTYLLKEKIPFDELIDFTKLAYIFNNISHREAPIRNILNNFFKPSKILLN
ncbi:MAG: radical SAM protein [Candidatus Nanoarchaeia archaeon]|jgi:radical SAM superfamily enzyme YgiQ (UPF0313 family)